MLSRVNELSTLALFVLLLPLILTVLEVEANTAYVVCGIQVVKDIERHVILFSILLCYAVGLQTLAIGTPSTSTLE